MQLITIPSDFRDAWFASDFGREIQAKLSMPDRDVGINFSNCAWIDPIPMLALLCHVKLWAGMVGTPKLRIDLGNVAVSGVNDDSSRARLFIVEHGFHKALVDACNSVIFRYESGLDGVSIEFKAEAVEDLADAVRKSTSVTLYYAPKAAFPPQVIESKCDGAKVIEFVDVMVQSVDDNIFRGRRSEFHHRDSALVRLRQIATEIVGNACEHAYDSDHPGPVYVYARLRHHNDHIGIPSIDQKQTDVETRAVAPQIHHIHDVTGDRYLEFFVCDIGKGLAANAEDWYEKASTEEIKSEFPKQPHELPKFPLRKLLSMLFRLPVSRHKRNVETETIFRSNITGLAHVNTVLSQHSDRSRIFVSPEWNAGKHPRPESYNGGPSDGSFLLSEPVGTAPSGSFFHFAIDLTANDLPLESYWLKPADRGEIFATSEFYKLRESFKPNLSKHAHQVFDLRQMPEGNRRNKPATDAEVDRQWARYKSSTDGLSIVRMSRDFRKNLTDRLITRWAVSAMSSANPAALAFCDLSQAQAILLKDHLERTLFPLPIFERERTSTATVIIIAENLVACILEFHRNETAKRWSFVVRASAPSAAEVMPILCTLRHHDSESFWKRVSLLCSKVQLIIRDVQWAQKTTESNGIRLPVYLDYSLAVQDRELAKILRRSLRRALSAFPELEVYAVDDLIKPDLDDARRWNRDVPLPRASESLFVLSSIVTGSTIDRASRYRGSSKAVLSGFFVDTDPTIDRPTTYYSALDWAPLSSGSMLPTERLWERIPGTPFVRPYTESRNEGGELIRNSLLRPVPRNIDKRKPGQNFRPSVTQAYEEWHRDKLLRVGHWSVDRRHGLIEIDHTRALQISAESRQGFYSWLAEELKELAKSRRARLLVYPASRLNAILIRHLQKMPGLDELVWNAIPINYLPDVGDGLRQIAPLTIEQIRTTDAARSGGVAVFIDIGFVGNRTFRHTDRQLRVLGVKQVIGMGLVNRTSFPALFEEMKAADVECYWRIDIPTLDDERSCPVCKGLDALLTLRERATIFQPALVRCVDSIRRVWALSEPSLSWWDHGLEPITLTQRRGKGNEFFEKKFGFRIPEQQPVAPVETDADGIQALLISDKGDVIPAAEAEPYLWPSEKVGWNYVILRSSTQAAAYAIEIARTQASPDYPWRLAKQIAKAVGSNVPVGKASDTVSSGAAVAIEIVSSHLLLCGGDLTVASREEGANLLLKYLMELESELINESQTDVAEQLRRLRGLATLAFSNLDSGTKRLILQTVVEVLSSVRIVNHETCIALMTIINNSAQSTGSHVMTTNSFEKMVNDRFVRLNASSISRDAGKRLIWNYRQIAVKERNLVDQFSDALRFFGAGVKHGQLLVVKKEAEVAQSNNQDQLAGVADVNAGWAILRSAFLQAHSMVCQGWQSTSSTGEPGKVVGELFRALCDLEPEVVTQLLDLSEIAIPENRRVVQDRADAVLTATRDRFQRAFIRIEPLEFGGWSLATWKEKVCDLLEYSTQEHDGAPPIGLTSNLDDFMPSASQNGAMRYILLGAELSQTIRRLRDDALQHGNKSPVPAPESFGDSEMLARLWVKLTGMSDGSLCLSFWNQGTTDSRADDFKSSARSLAPIHCELGTGITRDVISDNVSGRWFVTRITFKWIAGGNV